jgi:transcriptional regulator with XRE-family HTH domain
VTSHRVKKHRGSAAGYDTTPGAVFREWRLGAKFTQQEVANAAQALGLAWKRSTVAKIETGARELSLAEFFLFRGRGFQANDLGDFTDVVNTNRTVTLKTGVAEQLDAETAIARKLGVSARAVVAASVKLWGRTITNERDRLLTDRGHVVDERDARTLQATRGHITRVLVAKLRESMSKQCR